MPSKFQKWQVISGSHYQNGKGYKKGAKFVTDADMAKFNVLPHAPKYKLVGPATEAEILQFQADSGFSGTPEPKHVEDGPRDVTPIVDEDQLEVSEPEGEDLEESPEDSLEAMTVTELKALASDESIDISGLHLKAAIVAKIREGREEAAAE